jgi:hypothetical protein
MPYRTFKFSVVNKVLNGFFRATGVGKTTSPPQIMLQNETFSRV